MTESTLEGWCKREAKLRKGELLKFLPWLNTGFPDRILIMPGGWIVFCEFKAPLKGLRPKQKWWRDRLVNLGCNYAIIRTHDDFEEAMSPTTFRDLLEQACGVLEAEGVQCGTLVKEIRVSLDRGRL